MALKISYNDQIHRINAPQDYTELVETLVSKYPSLSSKMLSTYYFELPENNRINLKSENYQNLIELTKSQTKSLKVFIDINKDPNVIQDNFQTKAKEQEVVETNKKEVDQEEVQRDQTRVDRDKECVSMEEINKLQEGLLITMEDITYITRVVDNIKLKTLNKLHAYAAFIVFEKKIPNYLKCELRIKLLKELQINTEDVLISLDDIVIMTKNAKELQKALEATQEWALSVKPSINHEKSAVMEFLPRLARKCQITSSKILDIPVLHEYNYKGVWLDQKLMFRKQIDLIKNRVQAITDKMRAELSSVSFEARVEAWREFVEPLFESVLPGYITDKTVTRRNELERLVRVTFRNMTQLRKNYSAEEVERKIGWTLREKAQKAVGLYRLGWNIKH